MEQAGVADEDEMDLEEQGPTKVVQDMVGSSFFFFPLHCLLCPRYHCSSVV
jgi:hypothetical protein